MSTISRPFLPLRADWRCSQAKFKGKRSNINQSFVIGERYCDQWLRYHEGIVCDLLSDTAYVTNWFKVTQSSNIHCIKIIHRRECSKHTRNTMMFNIKIKDIKLLHSYPENQLCKKQMLGVFSHARTHTHTQAHTCAHGNKSQIHTEKAGYLQHEMAWNVQRENTSN